MSRIAAFPFFRLLFAALLFAACGPNDPRDELPEAKEPQIVSFSANPLMIEGSGQTTLSWVTEDATSLALTQNGEPVDLGDAAVSEGSIEILVEETTIFALVANGSHGTTPASAEVTVEVMEEIPPPEVGIFTGPEHVGADEDGVGMATLEWQDIAFAETLVLERDGGDPITIERSQIPDGSIEVQLTEDTTFRLVASNPSGEDSATHTVRLIQLPTIDSFFPDRELIGLGEAVQVSWSVSGAVGVELWANETQVTELDAELVEGSHTLFLGLPTIVTLRAYDELGREAESSVEISIGSPIIESIVGSSESMWLTETFTIEWEGRGGSSVVVTALGEDEPICEFFDLNAAASGSCSWVPPLGTNLVSVSVENSSGVTSETWEVYVGEGPVIAAFTVSRIELNLGDEVTLAWQVLADPDGVAADLTLRDDEGHTYPIDESEGSLTLEWTDRTGPIEFTLLASTDHPLSTEAKATTGFMAYNVPQISLVATPNHYNDLDDPVVLSWTTEFAHSAVIYKVEGENRVELLKVPEDELAAGSLVVDPLVDATYELAVTNPLGLTASENVSVTVALPEIIDLVADVSEIRTGGAVNLTWTTSMADEIRCDGQHSLDGRDPCRPR